MHLAPESRRRRGRDADTPRSRGAAAAETRICRGVALTLRPQPGSFVANNAARPRFDAAATTWVARQSPVRLFHSGPPTNASPAAPTTKPPARAPRRNTSHVGRATVGAPAPAAAAPRSAPSRLLSSIIADADYLVGCNSRHETPCVHDYLVALILDTGGASTLIARPLCLGRRLCACLSSRPRRARDDRAATRRG